MPSVTSMRHPLRSTSRAGATLDINGMASGNDFIYGMTLAGSGTAGQVHLINNGGHASAGWQQNANITLAANATIGGTGNIHMINSAYSPDTLDLAGFTLTKTGSNTFYLLNTTVTAGTIHIAGGTVSQTNVASNAALANVTFANTAGAVLALNGFNLTVASATSYERFLRSGSMVVLLTLASAA